MEKGAVTVLDLAQKFKESRHGQAIESRVSAIYDKMKSNPNAEVTINDEFEQLDHFATGWFKQVNPLHSFRLYTFRSLSIMTFSRKDNPWDMEITCLAIL
jgi:hypothetical protein